MADSVRELKTVDIVLLEVKRKGGDIAVANHYCGWADGLYKVPNVTPKPLTRFDTIFPIDKLVKTKNKGKDLQTDI